MKTEDLSKYRTQLTEQLKKLRKAAQSHQRLIDEGQTTKDFTGADRASELETMEVDSSIIASEANLAKKIEYALERVADGSYGVCEDCEGEIPEARLQTKPSVSLCVTCQEKHEAAE